jgi:hypothetical protein
MKIILQTEAPIAITSNDHLNPWGTAHDNSRNLRFNKKLYWLFHFQNVPQSQLHVLDLGCAGGGFVRDCVNDGLLAVGVEGSDFSRLRHRAEWAVIPDFLFTADITQPFSIGLDANGSSMEPLQFHTITAWEVLEHIPESGLPQLVDNVTQHLAAGGIWIASINTQHDIVNGIELHQTVKPREWWISRFQNLGLRNSDRLVRYFGKQFIRRPQGSFHVVLFRDGTVPPEPPQLSALQRLYDHWHGSLPQRALRKLVVGDA